MVYGWAATSRPPDKEAEMRSVYKTVIVMHYGANSAKRNNRVAHRAAKKVARRLDAVIGKD